MLTRLNGFDERFFYHFEECDLCCRVWDSGASILFFPGAEIIHLGGQSVGRFPIRFNLEPFRSADRFFYKHYGAKATQRIRRVFLLNLGLRYVGYKMLNLVKPSQALTNRLQMYQVALRWHYRLQPMRFIKDGEEPNTGYEPLAPAPKMMDEASFCVSH